MGLMEDLVDSKLATVVEFPDEGELLCRRKLVIGGGRAVDVLRVHKEDLSSGPEGSFHLLPKGLKVVRWDVRKPESEEDEIEAALGVPAEEIGLDKFKFVDWESFPAAREHFLRAIQCAKTARVGHQMAGPKSGSAGQFQAISEGRTLSQALLDLAELGSPLLGGAIAAIIATLPVEPLLVLAGRSTIVIELLREVRIAGLGRHR